MARNAGRGATSTALFEAGHRHAPARGRRGADLRRRPPPAPRASSTTSTRRCRPSRCTWPSPSPASASTPAGGARAARPAGRTRSTRSARSPTRSAVEVDRPRRQPGAVAPGSLRRDPGRRDRDRARGRAAPQGLHRLRRAGPHRRRRDRPRRAAPARGRPGARAVVLRLPGGQGGRRAGRRRLRARPPTSRPRCARAPASCWSRSGCSTSTPATRSGPARSRSRSRCGSGPPTGPSRRARPAPPVTPRWRWPRSAAAPCSGRDRVSDADDSAPGWDAIDAALAARYGDQEPRHVGSGAPASLSTAPAGLLGVRRGRALALRQLRALGALRADRGGRPGGLRLGLRADHAGAARRRRAAGLAVPDARRDRPVRQRQPGRPRPRPPHSTSGSR